MSYECTQAERKILELLWERGGMSVGQITRALQPEPGWTQHAVCTLIQRMKKKELIHLEESGSMERYVCRISRGQVTTAQPLITMSLPERIRNRFAKGGAHQ